MGGVTGRAGGDYEWTVTRYGQDAGLPWDKEAPRGRRDLLDIRGTLPAGFLVGCKAIRRTSFNQWLLAQRQTGRSHAPTLEEAYDAGVKAGRGKISEAMNQCDRALINLGRPYEKDSKGRLIVDCGGIVPVQFMQRSGYPTGKHYVVTQADYFMSLALERAKERADQ